MCLTSGGIENEGNETAVTLCSDRILTVWVRLGLSYRETFVPVF